MKISAIRQHLCAEEAGPMKAYQNDYQRFPLKLLPSASNALSINQGRSEGKRRKNYRSNLY